MASKFSGNLFQFSDFKKPSARADVKQCSLKNATEGLLDGSKFCFVHLGRKAYKNGAAECKALEASLPLPRTHQENSDLMEVVKQFGISKISNRNGIILDLTDLAREGAVLL